MLESNLCNYGHIDRDLDVTLSCMCTLMLSLHITRFHCFSYVKSSELRGR